MPPFLPAAVRATRRRALAGALAPLAAAVLGACSSVAPAPPPAIRPSASIQELMDAVIDPAADSLWDAVSSTHTAAGWEEHQPASDEDWQNARRNAIAIIEGANLILLPGRRVAHGYVPSEGAGVSDSIQVQVKLDETPQIFEALAHHLQDVATEALRAIDARDAKALLVAGGHIDEACESCHVTYWYPNQRIPPVPASSAPHATGK